MTLLAPFLGTLSSGRQGFISVVQNNKYVANYEVVYIAIYTNVILHKALKFAYFLQSQ